MSRRSLRGRMAVSVGAALLLSACSDSSTVEPLTSEVTTSEVSTPASSTTSFTTTTSVVSTITSTKAPITSEVDDSRSVVTIVIDQYQEPDETQDVPSKIYGIVQESTTLLVTDLAAGTSVGTDLTVVLETDPEFYVLIGVERVPDSETVLLWLCCEPGVGTVVRYDLSTGVAERVLYGGLGEGSSFDEVVIGSPAVSIVGSDGDYKGALGLEDLLGNDGAWSASLSQNTLVALVPNTSGSELVWLDVASFDDISELSRQSVEFGPPNIPSVALDVNRVAWLSDGSSEVVAWSEEGQVARTRFPAGVNRVSLDVTRRFLLVSLRDETLAWLDVETMTGGLLETVGYDAADW